GWGVRTACPAPPYRTTGVPSTEEAAGRTRGRARDCPRRRGLRCPRYDDFRAGRAGSASVGRSAVGAALGPAASARPGVGRGGSGSSRGLHLPRRAADRPAPQPARTGLRAGALPARAGGRDRLPRVRSGSRIGDPRSRDGRRAADASREPPCRQLLYGRVRTATRDGGLARPGASAALAEHAPPAPRASAEAGAEVPDVDRDEGRREVHDEGAELGRGRGARRLRPPVQHRARRRRVDLHAARHGPACPSGRSTVPARAGNDAARGAHGARARSVRARPARAVADHRRELRHRCVAVLGRRSVPARCALRAALRRLVRDRGADSVRRAVARRRAARAVRARAASAVGALGGVALPRHPAARGPRDRSEGDEPLAAAASAARHLRAARGRGDLRLPRHPRRAAAARRRARGVGVLLRARRAAALGRDGAGDRARARGRARPACGTSAALTVLLRAVRVARRFGSVAALVGPNGAGKSTLLAVLAGALEPSEGTIDAQVRVGWVPQRPAHYARLSARENLELFARFEGVRDPAAAAGGLLERFSLPTEPRPSGELSVGNRQRLNVALSLLAEPRVLLLDEPTAAL